MVEKVSILVVDDEIGTRESLRTILKPYYNVYTAEEGGRAIEILNQVPIGVVTLDIKMPGLAGTRVLEKVKQRDPDIEAIIITGYGSMETAIDGLRLGAFDYVTKPFDVNLVLTLVRRALERRNARQKLRQLKSEFFANLSHELRTPLSVVIGFVSLLLGQSIGKLTDEQRDALERAYKNSEELLELVDNVLYLSSLDTGDLSKEEGEVDLCAVIKKGSKRYEKTAAEKGIHFTIRLPREEIWIVSDPAKLARIFQNLLHNAIKFTPSGQITIKVHRSMRRRVVDLEIVDKGIGIPRDQIETMFQPFRQLDSSLRRRFSGLGLGLSVARQLTDFIGGTLEMRSQPGMGTHVLLSIPCLQRSEEDPTSEYPMVQ